MATLDEIRLQQLLAPFNRTGVMSSNQAVPMINNIPMINTGAIDQSLQNTDLVEQIIAENQMKANTADTAPFFFPTSSIRQQVPQIAQDTIASNLLYEDMPSGGDYDYDYDYESIQPFQEEEQKKSNQGLAGLFKTLIGFAIPGANLFMGDRSALEGIKSLNQKLRSTDFAQSKTLADYFDARRYGGRDARDAAAARNMAQARGLQKQIDQRQSAVQTNQDKGRGDRPGGANYSAPSKPSRASSYRDSSSFGKSFHSG